MRYAALLIPAVVYCLLLSAKANAMDENTKQGIANFTLLTAAVFLVSATAQPKDAKLTFFNYAKFEVGSNSPINGYSRLCDNRGHLTSSGEIRVNAFEYGVFYGDLVPWSHRSCVDNKDKFVIDTYAVRIGVQHRFK